MAELSVVQSDTHIGVTASWEAPIQIYYKCLECDALNEEQGSSLYECGECGTKYTRDTSADGDSHRCPNCNRFGAKLADYSCLECEAGEVESVDAVQCPECLDIIEVDLFESHIADSHIQ